MAEINYTRPFLFPYQKEILNSPARFTVTEAATKCGKTASHIIWLLEQALGIDRNQSVWWVAPVYTQAKIAFDRMRDQITDKNFFKVNETSLTLTLPTGAKIQFKSAEKPDNLYGDDVYAAVFDEFTRAREEAWHALRSTLTSTGGRCKFIGNVKGKKNWGHQMAMRAKNGEQDYEYFKITAYDAAEAGMLTKDGRPFIEEIESARRDMPEAVFRELYLAEASEDGSNPFGLQFIEQCTYPLSSLPPVCFGIDLANSFDYVVIIGLDQFGRVCHFQRFNKAGWTNTKEIIGVLPKVSMQIDSTGVGDPIVHDIQRIHQQAVGFKFSSISKQQIMEKLALAIQQRRISFPEYPTGKIPIDHPGNIKHELENFEFEHTRTGIRYSAPNGMHDDCVCALALANDIFTNAAQLGNYSWA